MFDFKWLLLNDNAGAGTQTRFQNAKVVIFFSFSSMFQEKFKKYTEYSQNISHFVQTVGLWIENWAVSACFLF